MVEEADSCSSQREVYMLDLAIYSSVGRTTLCSSVERTPGNVSVSSNNMKALQGFSVTGPAANMDGTGSMFPSRCCGFAVLRGLG